MRWKPGPDWTPLSAGTGTSDGGVWLTPDGAVVKRLVPGTEMPGHYSYWRRQAEVATSRILETTSGLRAPTCLGVDSDPDGITLWTVAVEPVELEPIELAEALGRFSLNRMPQSDWFARRILRDRLANDEGRGGWAALADSPQLDAQLRQVCDDLWGRRSGVLAELDRLPQVVIHGDAHPVNLLGREGDAVVAVDWEQFGIGPLGFDLGYLLLSTDAPLDELVEAYQHGSGSAWPVDVVRRGAVLTAAVTVVARAAWSIAQPDPGDHLERLERLAHLVAEAC
jgi:hypothetical protein